MAANPRLSFDASRITNYGLRVAPYLPLLALIALAIYPILTSGLPTTGDGLNHYYRLVELDWHIQHGDFYPRWFTNMGYGYGLPVLSFYAPLTYYIPLIFKLTGFSLGPSLQLSYALALAIAILGAYQWASLLTTEPPHHPTTSFPSRFLSPLLPLLISAAYGLAPYFYFNIFHRGAYPETWALALLPWLLWSTHKFITSPTIVHCSLFSVHFSALILTHTLSALIFTPLVAVYFYLVAFVYQRHTPDAAHITRYALRFTLAVGLALLLTSFFTLPVLFESQYIQLQRTYSTGDLDYHRNFLTLAQLFSAPPNFDPQLVFNAMPPSLGWPQMVLGVGGWLLILSRQWAHGRRQILMGLVLTAFCLLLSAFTLSFSEPLWNLFPFARFIQFPWRLVGPASLFLATLAGLGFVSLTLYASRIINSIRILEVGLLGVCLSSFFFFSLSWTYHADFNSPFSNSPSATINYELTSGQLGTSSTGEYLPTWVTDLPDPQTNLAQLSSTDLISHLASAPAALTHYELRNSLNTEELSYTANTDPTLTYNIFYFPGWVADLDGQPTGIQPSSPNGLITITVPAGSHILKLYRQLTPPQFIGTLISGVTLLALIVILVSRRSSPISHFAFPLTNYELRSSSLTSACIFALLLSRVLYFDRTETIFHHTNSVPNPTAINFGDQLELIGYDYPQSLISNSPISITLYWRALQPLAVDYSVSVQLADRFGHRFGQSDSQHPNGVPTSRWALDQYARDSHPLTPKFGIPPGAYHLLVTVYSDQPLSVIQDSAPIGDDYDLGTVQVRPPPASPAGPLALTDSPLSADSLTVGDSLTINALWFTGNDRLPSLTATVELTDDSGQTIYSESQPPTGIDYPTDQWALNTEIRYPLTITLPPDLPGGAARVRLSLTDATGATAAGPFDLGSITILMPQRSFDLPIMQVRVDHDFENTLRLLGYNKHADSITLYWQSLKAISGRLTVFVHALNEDGGFANGHDAQPLRPTTSWLPGEIITDIHPIVVGNRFEVGLYDPISGDRFGEIFVTLP